MWAGITMVRGRAWASAIRRHQNSRVAIAVWLFIAAVDAHPVVANLWNGMLHGA
jgi:hypothetical protein